MKAIFSVLILLLLAPVSGMQAQAGISVSPGKLYYSVPPGGKHSQVLKVSNPTDAELEVGVSFSDWDYDEAGNNRLLEAGSLDHSNIDWVQVLPETFFILKPRETREIEVVMDVPDEAATEIPVRTGMLFLTQLNPGKAKDKNGAAIQVSVRMGVKLYHGFEQESRSVLEIVNLRNFKSEDNGAKMLELSLENQGRTWTNGTIRWELFNNDTGEKQIIGEKDFYTLPGDLRKITQNLPEELSSGTYTISAIMTYGEGDRVNIAELDLKL